MGFNESYSTAQRLYALLVEHGAKPLSEKLHIGILLQIPAHLLAHPQIEAMLDLKGVS